MPLFMIANGVGAIGFWRCLFRYRKMSVPAKYNSSTIAAENQDTNFVQEELFREVLVQLPGAFLLVTFMYMISKTIY